MAVTVLQRDVTAAGKQVGLVVADTAAELVAFTAGIGAGAIGFAVDNLAHYVFDGTTWNKRVSVSSYALQVAAANAATLTDAQTLYFGGFPSVVPGTTAAVSRVYIPRAGTIVATYIYGRAGTAGTNESWSLSVRLNNTTDALVQALASNSADRVWLNAAMSMAVAAGDYVEIKSANPTWATNPANLTWNGTILVRESQ